MRQLLAVLTATSTITSAITSAILLALPAIAQDPTGFQSGFQASDAQNGIFTDSSGFRHSSVSIGNSNYHQPHYRHRSRYYHKPHFGPDFGVVGHPIIGQPTIGQPTIVISPNPVIVPHRPILGHPRSRPGIIIAPTINFGGGFNSGLCTTTNIVTSADGTVFRSTTTQPCNF